LAINRAKRLVIIWFDILYTAFFVIYLTIFKIWSNRAIRKHHEKNSSVSRYTLIFNGFKNSDKVTEKEVKEFLESKVEGEIIEVIFA